MTLVRVEEHPPQLVVLAPTDPVDDVGRDPARTWHLDAAQSKAAGALAVEPLAVEPPAADLRMAGPSAGGGP